MINFIYGVAGSGKSTYIEEMIKKDIGSRKPVYLIVPEQQTYSVERRYSVILPPFAQLQFEVINFTRLANIAERKYGGLSYNYIDKSTKTLLMWSNLHELAPLLGEYGKSANNETGILNLTDMMLSLTDELKSASLTPAKLESAAAKLDKNSSLYSRIMDIALIWAAFSNQCKNGFDDASDDLDKLYELLCDHDMLKGYSIYIDSFTSYTNQQYKIIDLLMKQADNVTITVGCDRPHSGHIHFASLYDTSDILHRYADGRGEYKDIILKGTKRFRSAGLETLEHSLWDIFGNVPSAEAMNHDGIELIRCSDPYEEAETAAITVLNALREGYRCREIAVIMRDSNSKKGIIDAVFDKYGIPYFMSEHTDISSSPLIKMINSVMRIKNYGWQKSDVISLLKTDLCGIDRRSVDIFEDYCDTWNITGRVFTEPEWTLNPDGYRSDCTERGKEILRIANDVKNKLVAPLSVMFAEFDRSDNIRDYCKALYEYTETLGVYRSLSLLAEKEKSMGDIRASEDTLKMYKLYTDILDKLVLTLKDMPMDSNIFAGALRVLFNNVNIGSIPTRNDEVTIGSASLLRSDNIRMAIVTGLCEGEFPADVNDSGLLSFADRTVLRDIGLNVNYDRNLRYSDELFFVYRAFTSPSERLVMTFSEKNTDGTSCKPSRAVERVISIFNDLPVTDYSSYPLIEKLQTPSTAVNYIKDLGNTQRAELLKACIAKDENCMDILKGLDYPMTVGECNISGETSDIVYGNRFVLSPSKIESFVNCPLRYHCNSVLGLRESEKAGFSYSEVGTFIHYVMESFMRAAMNENGNFDPDMTDDKARILADDIIDKYLEKILPSAADRAAHLTFLISKLKRIALVIIFNIIEEFAHCKFVPSFFEMKMSVSTGTSAQLNVNGVIDRIDLLKKGDDIYIRIIDYKTGNKEFSKEEIKDGIGLQLLLYLFTLCKFAADDFKKTLGCNKNARLIPAGALYLSANIPIFTVDERISAEEIREKAFKEIKRSGPLLDDDQILEAMDDSPSHSILNTEKLRKKIGNERDLLSPDEFDLLCSETEKVIENIGKSIRSGKVSAKPRLKKNSSPCNNCPYASVCRSPEYNNFN